MREEWTIERIKKGFERFQSENGRLPIAPEIDQLDYLPSSRQIQRKFGGLEKLRGALGYDDVHFGKGANRSAIAKRTNKKGREVELELEVELRKKFGEVFVHTERIFDMENKNRVDFYVYTPDGNFGIDIFYTETMRDLQKNVNVKIDKYTNFPHKLYFVVANSVFNQDELDAYMRDKKKALPADTSILTLETLHKVINSKTSYPNPFS